MTRSILEIGPPVQPHAGPDQKTRPVRRGTWPFCARQLYKSPVFARLKQPPAETTYALLRIVSGLMFAFHGIQKVFGFHAKAQPAVGSQVWIGGVIEVVCGLCIALGFYTRAAAFLASGTMAVAYFKAHAPNGFWPVVNRGELAALYSFLFLYLAARGSGILSLDRLRGKK